MWLIAAALSISKTTSVRRAVNDVREESCDITQLNRCTQRIAVFARSLTAIDQGLTAGPTAADALAAGCVEDDEGRIGGESIDKLEDDKARGAEGGGNGSMMCTGGADDVNAVDDDLACTK